jgi:hypothetical protein
MKQIKQSRHLLINAYRNKCVNSIISKSILITISSWTYPSLTRKSLESTSTQSHSSKETKLKISAKIYLSRKVADSNSQKNHNTTLSTL